MSRFGHLLENAPTQSTLPSVVNLHVDITFSSAEEGMTSSSYPCYPSLCETGGCKTPLAYIINPEYHCIVGTKTGTPLELVFTPLPSETVTGDKGSVWAEHPHATGNAIEVTCPVCEVKAQFRIATDGGLMLQTEFVPVDVPIPKNRFPYISTPLDSWELVK